ncbi:hypothetical protein [Maridesulfovibrio salexigens]|uniref:Uncharacterized protein n=1 Tax=Maridesulfovibrio salexigens (strain ATCC 14822 / DSM 2638 / NCIMB 8403 / VKM B-1763) TaxID=526222 RepID=C6BZW0_MARSD|nr:hypothetical protein [Maridesulfovibrio salexigens]ACS79017.1 hypothetical protein Desal_0952 [Maridesulfovibrio salexigens DSM 2638]
MRKILFGFILCLLLSGTAFAGLSDIKMPDLMSEGWMYMPTGSQPGVRYEGYVNTKTMQDILFILTEEGGQIKVEAKKLGIVSTMPESEVPNFIKTALVK